MNEVNYIPGNEVILSFTVNGMRGEMYNIKNFSSLNTVTTYSSGRWIYIVAVS